jgi:hypothetical protein
MHTRTLLTIASALAVGTALSHAQPVLVYSENFGTPGNTDVAITTVGWTMHYGSGLLGEVANTSVVGTTNGGNADPANVNAGASGTTSKRTFINGGASAGFDLLFWTEEHTIDRSLFSPTSVVFEMANSDAAASARVAVRIGTSWFASDAVFSTPASGSGTWTSRTFTWSNDASAWRALTFDGTFSANGTGLSIGASTLGPSLPAVGNITAFGLYYDSQIGNMRTSLYQINATPIPEPSSFAALAALGCLAFATTRRRRLR